jgi:hypothetical protein
MVTVPHRAELGSAVVIAPRLKAAQPENLCLIPGKGRDISPTN